jgi:hypothetical protein
MGHWDFGPGMRVVAAKQVDDPGANGKGLVPEAGVTELHRAMRQPRRASEGSCEGARAKVEHLPLRPTRLGSKNIGTVPLLFQTFSI